MWKRRLARQATAIVFMLAANLWCLWHNHETGALISFAATCFLAGESLDVFARRREERLLPRADASLVLAGGSRIPLSSAAISALQTDRAASIPAVCNAFTIDLEDYFHTEVSSRSVSFEDWDHLPSRIDASVMRLLDLLDEHNTRATVFTLGWVARKRPDLIREVSRRGHEIACHSYRHRPVFRLSPDEFRTDTDLAKTILEDITGSPVIGYRAPNFSIIPGVEWAWKVLADLGFLYDSSVNPVWHKMYANPKAPRFPYLIPGTNLFEVPVATWRVCGVNLPIGGGAYLRLLPLPYVRLGLSMVNSLERKPATLYIHPWEIDCFQPELDTDWKSRIRQTWGLSTMEAKVAELLRGGRFDSIKEVHSDHLPYSALLRALRREPDTLARAS